MVGIWHRFAVFLLQGVVYIPLYAVLFCHFLKYVNVKEKVWKRAFILAGMAYVVLTLLSVAFGMFSDALIGQFIGALVMAYILTRLLIVPYHNAAVAALMIAIIGYDIPPVIFNFINLNIISNI